ncbi:Vacuolar protein sorting-associated protein 53 [Agyrium rufum]|nr:Vacuolar protein sorting-associated protein 53 [Agyrium rufum]
MSLLDSPNLMDSTTYDPVEHLNAIFSHPSALSSVAQTNWALSSYHNEINGQIEDAVAHQSASDIESVQRMKSAKDDLADLFTKIEGVRERALRTEQAITEMTADIKRLDNTKKNLTLSMTALKRLQMLTTAYEQLRGSSSSRQYKESSQSLQAVIQLMAHFKSYRSIEQIATLSKNVSDVQRELLEQICEDFETAFTKGELSHRRAMLSEACMVMDALGDNARSRLITWYCNTQLREYRQVFRGNDEAGSLENLSRRYSWFKRMLKTYDEQHHAIFPPAWRVDEMLANAFCESTRDDFMGILSKAMARRTAGARQTLDVNLLLSCLQETLEFEHGLEKKFNTSSRMSIDTFASADEKPSPFSHAISGAFEPYLSIWVDAQDRELSILMPRYRQAPLQAPDEDFSAQMVIPSSTELFNFYRLTFAQCAKLSTGARLVELSKVFAKYLDLYAQQVLFFNISERPTGQTPSKVPTTEDIILVLNTADYCYTTCNQLEERIRSRVDDGLKEEIDLQSQADAFMGVASASIRSLVRRVEIDLEPVWREMRNIGLNKLQSVSDHSSYVDDMQRRITVRSSEILAMLHKSQYARAFCDNLVEFVSNDYVAAIIHCRPVTEVGAEQLLLDSYALTQTFQSLLPNPTQAYTKRVTQTVTLRLSPLLKTLQVRPSPPEALVQAYLIHIADKSEINFRKILDLKGITTKKDQSPLIELFQVHRDAPRYSTLPQSSAFLNSVSLMGVNGALSTGGVVAGAVGSTLQSTANSMTGSLQGRFDPTTFGSAIMTAARDGVDRFGSPALSGSTSNLASRAVSPPPTTAGGQPGISMGAHNGGLGVPTGVTAGIGGGESPSLGAAAGANVNQNLRNIGAFFKRDLSAFGGRFGKGGTNMPSGDDGLR